MMAQLRQTISRISITTIRQVTTIAAASTADYYCTGAAETLHQHQMTAQQLHNQQPGEAQARPLSSCSSFKTNSSTSGASRNTARTPDYHGVIDANPKPRNITSEATNK
jgi:hypothetical protein